MSNMESLRSSCLIDYARWLGEEPDPRDLMRPFPSQLMRMWPISTRVNKPENDDPSIVEPIQLTTDAAKGLLTVKIASWPTSGWMPVVPSQFGWKASRVSARPSWQKLLVKLVGKEHVAGDHFVSKFDVPTS
jgi:hypothetical protein